MADVANIRRKRQFRDVPSPKKEILEGYNLQPTTHEDVWVVGIFCVQNPDPSVFAESLDVAPPESIVTRLTLVSVTNRTETDRRESRKAESQTYSLCLLFHCLHKIRWFHLTKQPSLFIPNKRIETMGVSLPRRHDRINFCFRFHDAHHILCLSVCWQ